VKRLGGADAVLGLALTTLLGGLAFLRPAITESLELKLYDLRLRLMPTAVPSDDLRLVVIDEPSIEAVGRWPWPRGHVAELLRRISDGKPKVIGLTILYVDPDENQGLEALRGLRKRGEGILKQQRAAAARKGKAPRARADVKSLAPWEDFLEDLSDAEQSLDNDAQLAEALQETRGVVLPFSFATLDKPLVDETPENVERMSPRAFLQAQVDGDGSRLLEGFQPLLPIPAFAKGVVGIGHSNIFSDVDGTVRRDAVIMKYKGQFHPSMALEMARVALGIPTSKIAVDLGREIRLGDKKIPLDPNNRLLIKYQGPFAGVKRVSAVDVLRDEGGVAPAAFKNKVVLIGLTALGLGNVFVTPVEATHQFNGILTASLQNILEGDFLRRPSWAGRAEAGVLLLIGLFVTLLLPRLRARAGALVSGALLLAVLGAGFGLFMTHGLWIRVFYPLALLTLAYGLITARRFFFVEQRKEFVEAQSAETNKMLGLSFQGQGLLDMALEKLQKCPVDEEMKGVLYNLALDFERKRQFNKAVVVYEHIAKADPNFKDIKEKAKSMKQAGETMIMGAGLGGGKQGGTLVMGEGAAKPTLGRYEIQKELGRGAMGVVYLGKDPKINRPVAIKTLRFDDDMDAETAKFTKDRFFREAESAGTLNHPNIIRIFDAGEDNEISFIAMEFLEGEDLKKYVEKDNLLPVPQVLEYVALIADALDYAHTNGVIHRDVKPANMMRLKDGTLRVTDFGIARITASSKTATGTVMGTPSYMSPEQLSGKKVNGRSDLFSLGVMLYEMLAGEKPFEGDSIATLLFKIANEPHPDPRFKRADRVSAGIKAVIDKALQKDPDLRYQRGGEMAKDIRACVQSPDAVPAGAVEQPPAAARGGPGLSDGAAAADSPPDPLAGLAPLPLSEPTVRVSSPYAGGSDTVKLNEPPSGNSNPDGTQKL